MAFGGPDENYMNWGNDFLGRSSARKADELTQEQKDLAGQQYRETMGQNQAMDSAENRNMWEKQNAIRDYNKQLGAASYPYIRQNQRLDTQSWNDRQGLSDTYGTANGNLASLMGTANRNAGQAMSLSDAMNPNNSVQRGYEGMYNAEGAKQYGQAKSLIGSMQAGQPTPGLNPTLSNATNQSMAGQAMAAANRRLEDIRNQGRVSAYNEAKNQYERGRDARGFSQALTKQQQGMSGAYQNAQAQNRENQAQFKKNTMSTALNMYNRTNQNNRALQDQWMQNRMNTGARNVAAINQRGGSTMAANIGGMQNAGAQQGILQSFAPAIGAGAARAYGGPQAQQAPQGQPAAQTSGYGQNAGYGVSQPNYVQKPAPGQGQYQGWQQSMYPQAAQAQPY